MAKNFLKVYQSITEQTYSSGVSFLTILAAFNSACKFTKILRPNGQDDLTKSSQYVFQRRMRPTVNTIANVGTGATADALKALDQFSEVEWETQVVVTGVLRSVGFKKHFKDEFDFIAEGTHKEDIKYQIGETAVARHKDILTLIQNDAKVGKTSRAIPAYTKGDTKVWQEIATQVITLTQVDDRFKDVQTPKDFVIFGSPTIAKELTLEMGTVFNNEAPIAETGFNTGNSVDGVPFIVEPRWAGREVVIAHKEAIGFKSEQVKEVINIDLGLTVYNGIYFFDILTIVDEARIKQLKA